MLYHWLSKWAVCFCAWFEVCLGVTLKTNHEILFLNTA